MKVAASPHRDGESFAVMSGMGSTGPTSERELDVN